MSPYYLCVVLSLPALIIYLLGAAQYLSKQEKNTCQMTYMFEYPQYVHIHLEEEIQKQYPQYKLYAYAEGFAVGRIQSMRFYGIPVLFIPGNAGSHHQVRSLASVSLRKSLKDRTPFHFDFFTVDLNEEYSALYGGVLKGQTKFVAHCIQKILRFYSGKIDSIILIGHSMGGIVAKGVLLEPNITISQVNTIIMLATPHMAALIPDTYIAAIHQKLKHSQSSFNNSGIVTLSIGGGPRDVVVNSNQVIDEIADLNVLTTQIPSVWKSTDHLAILWCKEFVLVVIRALFDTVYVDTKYPKINTDKDYRLKVFNYHFLERSAGKKFAQYKSKVQFDSGGEWIEDIRRQYTWKALDRIGTNNKSQVYLMIRLIGRQDRLTIQTTNLEARNWLFACTASSIEGNSRVCDWGWNLSNKSRIMPGGTHKTKIVDLDPVELKALHLTHVVIRVPASNFNKWLSIGIDLHEKGERRVNVGNKFNAIGLGFGKLGTIETSNAAIRYEVNLDNTTDSVLFKLSHPQCNQKNYRHHSAVELLEPGTNGISQVRLFTYHDTTPKIFKLQTRNTAKDNVPGIKSPILRFTLDPECVYTIELWHGSLMETVASAVRYRWPNLYGIIVGLLLLILAKYIDGELKLVNSAIVTTITCALCLGLGIGLEALVALGIIHVCAAVVCCTVILLGSTVYNMANRFLARSLKFSMTWTDWILGGLNQLPLLSATILLAVVPVTCGALAMFLFLVLQFLKLVKLYEDYLEKLLLAILRFGILNRFRRTQNNHRSKEEDEKEDDGDSDGNQIAFQLLLFLIWCTAAIPAIPSVLVWAKNYRYSTRLETEDPFLMMCWTIIIGCASGGVTWISPSKLGYFSSEIAMVLRVLGWGALVVTGIGYPQQYQYLMPPFIVAGTSLVAIRPLIGFRSLIRR
ncbi:GPI inositol-deacylase isoform X1 [Athalia rosae]|uniref:GPI inositol-deacylase isoform X1 n=1 Tax=Athalia rosae TaxID=37344 RepID=UPI0020342789|nr:GPI inositol-deacylase isoform X1 [Athalia rosae]